MINSVLIDARNIDEVGPRVADLIKGADFPGLDCETQDSNRHEGLNQFCKYDEDGFKAKNTKLVFDMKRTVMTGFSVYTEGSKDAFYVNLNHADVENRVPWEKGKRILDAKREGAHWIAHNAPYELTAFRSCYNYRLPEIICTLQMLVSCYGPDDYSLVQFENAGQGGIERLVFPIMQEARKWVDTKQDMPPELMDLVTKIIAKSSDAAHSYNGYVKDLAWGYGLKQAVRTHFGHKMSSFEETLDDNAHMGQLTGEQVVDYGCEDAYWAVRLFRRTMERMQAECPEAVPTFFEQENPMVHVFSDIWFEGMTVDLEAINRRRVEERANFAQLLREFKALGKQLLPFPTEPNQALIDAGEKWYFDEKKAETGKPQGYLRYRDIITTWLTSPDSDDDYIQAQQVRGAVSNAWASDKGQPESKGVNLTHYMPMRTLFYDLMGAKIIKSDGKVQSDANCRGRIKTRLEKQGNEVGTQIIDSLNKMASVEQRMKLYLTPYVLLTDPETNRMYPVVSSMLATRRMACSVPNTMQLAKRGESTYVRGFFEADSDEEVIVSIDWSAIELVDIGEKSGDPEFFKAFGQLPHEDMHTGAAADILTVDVPKLTEEKFKLLKSAAEWGAWHEATEIAPEESRRILLNLKGEPFSEPSKAAKYWRTEVGKGANFNYWYSGWLATIGERMGWDQERTKLATERYRNRFAKAEEWRLETIQQVERDGYVILPDGHRRNRYEATDEWFKGFISKFQRRQHGTESFDEVWRWIANKIAKRARNQAVNAMIQGSCATLAKRSILRSNEKIRKEGFKARFMMPIHDELLWSVHRKEVVEFIEMARGVMINHPDLYKSCKLDASPAVGITFEPWHAKAAPWGQIELFEAPEIPTVAKERVGKHMTNDEVRASVDHLFELRNHMRMAA